MPVAGVVLQQVSIAAIIISLGLLVDNGVVIIEDMDSRIREGSSRTDAARAAGSQYTLPLAIASVTTAAAFLPLFLLDGTEGQYGYSLGAVVALMLTGSFIAATSFLPVLAIRFLPEPKATPAPGILERLGTGYGRLVRLGLRAPWVMVLLCLLVVAGGVSQMGKVPQQMFPLSERAQLLVYFDLPRGSDISATESEALRFSEWLRSNEEVTSVTSFIGYGGPRFVLSLDPAETDPASAFMVVNTSDFWASEKLLPRARAELDRAFPDARVRLKRVAMGGREPGLEVAISGPDPDRLLAAAHDVEAGFSSAPGLTENAGDWGNRRLIGRVIVAQDEARLHGLSTRDLSQTMAGMLEGRPISVLREGDSQIPITLRLDPESMEGPMAVANMTISTSAGLILTEQIASFEPDLEFSSLRRVNGQRRVTATAISTELTALALADHIAPTLERLQEELGPEYDIALGGEIEQSAEVREKLGGGFPAAVAVMLVALMVQFNSFRRVVVTLACVPLVIAGVPLALLAFGQPLSFFGTLGMIALSGIVINNAIVLIDQIDIERRTMSLDAAIAESARKRFRPILLTSLTTVLGLIPMATTGGGLWEPMATLMIGGLGLASVLTLFYVPALYRLAFSREINGGPQV
ncbi:acriflavin resistance protein [Nitratireductor aquibiodomus RA22]|uniref:Acriflavin resistance protein n=1 Tax=Nitratireductor aquibiodomus RA22 TaxID=1189611 RepID=I5C558_9HYPH|nr:acriflavin resistance protein [Nitratireductor aquibiodomus RA22]